MQDVAYCQAQAQAARRALEGAVADHEREYWRRTAEHWEALAHLKERLRTLLNPEP